MASGFSGGGGGPEYFGVGGRSMSGGPGTAVNSGNNNPQPTYRNQIPGIFLDQIGNGVPTGHRVSGKRTLADFQAAQQKQQQQQQQHPFYNQAALNAFLLRSVKPRNFQNLQSPPMIDLTSMNDLSLLNGPSHQRYSLPLLRSQTQQQSDLSLFGGIRMGFGSGNHNSTTLTGVPCIEPVQNRVQESENMLNSLRELEKQLLDDDDDDDEGDVQGGGEDDVSVITNSNSDWLQNLVTPNPVSSSSPSSSSSSSSPSTASTTTSSVCSRQTVMEIA